MTPTVGYGDIYRATVGEFDEVKWRLDAIEAKLDPMIVEQRSLRPPRP